MIENPEVNDGWRARVVGSDPISDTLRIIAGRRGSSGGSYVTAFGAGSVEVTFVDSAVVPPEFAIPEVLARVLFDALAEHFGGTSVGRQARADFLHERGRVDKLIDTVTTIATKDHP